MLLAFPRVAMLSQLLLTCIQSPATDMKSMLRVLEVRSYRCDRIERTGATVATDTSVEERRREGVIHFTAWPKYHQRRK